MKTLLLLVLSLVATGCGVSRAPPDSTESTPRARAASTKPTQGTNDIDNRITWKIRVAVMTSDTLSLTAKSVKIVTSNAKVTLRGPVQNDAERSKVAAIAMWTEGVNDIDNQLEITTE